MMEGRWDSGRWGADSGADLGQNSGRWDGDSGRWDGDLGTGLQTREDGMETEDLG